MADMSAVNIAAVDLNLLVVLDAVLEEGSATRAAARLHVTQSAVSNALRRLRATFGDPLVVRLPRGLVPTARGQALAPEVRAVLDAARRLFGEGSAFDAKTTERTFSIACSDAVAATLLPALLARMARALPAARLRLVTIDRMVATDGLARGDVDLLVGIPPSVPPGCSSEKVYDDPMLCLLRKGHPRSKARLSLDAFCALPHVELALFGQHDETIDRALAARGRARVVKIAVPHFSSIPLAVLETDCVATLSGRIASAFAARLPLVVVRPPIALPTLTLSAVWHRRSDADPGVTLLRRLLQKAARDGANPRARSR